MVFKLPNIFSASTEWLERQQSSILSAAAVITVANAVSALGGILRQRLLYSHFVDTTLESKQAYEAFLFAFSIPDMMFKLIILGALSAAFIPIFSQYKAENEQKAFELTSNLMTLLLSIFVIVGGLVFLFAHELTLLQTGPQFTPMQVEITTNLTRIMVAAQFFFAISNFLTGVLQSYRKFVLPAIAPIAYQLGIVLASYALSPFFGIYAAGWGVVFGAFLHMFIQLPATLRLGFRYRPSFHFIHPGIKKVIRLTPARTATLGIGEIQDLFLNKFVTSLSSLSFMVLNFSQMLMSAPIRFFGVPIGQAALPFLAAESNGKDLNHFRDLILKLIHQVSFFALPASVLLIILRVPIVRIAFGDRDFDWPMTITTSNVVGIIALSITAQAIVQLLVRAFYALKNTKTPFYISMFTALLLTSLSALLSFQFGYGVYGIALSISVSYIVEMLLIVYFLNNQIRGLMSKAFWVPQFKMITASFLMAVFLYLPFKILGELVFNTARTVELILLTVTTSTIGTLVYLYFAALFDIRELYILQKILDKVGSWQKTLSQSPEVVLERSADNHSDV